MTFSDIVILVQFTKKIIKEETLIKILLETVYKIQNLRRADEGIVLRRMK